METTDIVISAIAAYLVGSIPTGYLVARARGIDIRSTGSGNIGATNVFRVLGKGAGIFVLLVDAAKGFLPTYFLPILLTPAGVVDGEVLKMVAGLFAILGHNYTCWLQFKGGKGVATSAGVLLALVPPAFGIALATFLIVLGLSRIVSVSSISAALVLPLAVWLTGESGRMIGVTAIFSGLAIYKHRANIQRLRAGTEPRLGERKK